MVNALEKRKRRKRAEPRKKNTFESRIYKLLVKKLNEESTVKLMTQKITRLIKLVNRRANRFFKMESLILAQDERWRSA